MLLDRGAAVDVHDDAGDTPLHKAAYADRPEAVNLLAERKAEVNAPNSIKQTPLHRCVPTIHITLKRNKGRR